MPQGRSQENDMPNYNSVRRSGTSKHRRKHADGVSKTPSVTPRRKRPAGDRFIPNRSSLDVNSSHYNLITETQPADLDSPSRTQYRDSLSDSMFKGEQQHKVLTFSQKAPTPSDKHRNELRVLYSQNKQALARSQGVRQRKISTHPVRIFDLPDLVDDYYLNLLDWNQDNLLAVALGASVYVWNGESGDVSELFSLSEEGEYVTSVSWIPQGSHLAIGTSNAAVQLFDVATATKVRNMTSHTSRVGSLSWNEYIVSSGSQDSDIHHHDVRVPDHHIGTLPTHRMEVCGLKWSPDGKELASGGNDNLLCIWDSNYTSQECEPRFQLTQHQAAVKALAWCPFQRNLLASGGGTADRTIRFWNSQTGANINTVDTQSQVCSLVWSKLSKELVSSHGYAQNDLAVWRYPAMAKLAQLSGHTERVLHLALSPDGRTVVSAGDDTLRFWEVFDAKDGAGGKGKGKGKGAGKGASGPGGNSHSSRSFMRGMNLR